MGETNAIETSRLVLVPLSTSDLDEMHALWTVPEVRRHLFDGESTTRVEAGDFLRRSDRDFEERGHGLWGARRKGSENLVGFCGLFSGTAPSEAELLYGLDPRFWGGGFAVEAAGAVILFGFERAGLSRICASADEPNVASIKVMERLGMRFEGREVRDGGSLVHYGIRVGEFSKDDTKPV